jgi:tRNA pseudouridine55 synthase
MNAWPVHTFETWEDFQEGQVLLIDKPLEWTSFDVVNKLRYAIRKGGGFRKIKVGHAGTLDPLATGVLVVCTGRMTKRINELTAEDKAYDGHITFGSTTDSHDLETEPQPSGDASGLTLDALHGAIGPLTGPIQQVPPRFSAKKVNGQKAYIAARKGKDIALRTADVTVHRFDITDWTCPVMGFDILCSKGTYIRALARDAGKAAGVGAHLSALRRTASGAFKLEDCLSIDAFLERLEALPAPAPKAD